MDSSLLSKDKKFCECGCGEIINARNKVNRPLRFKIGHQWIGRRLSQEHKQKLSVARLAEKHPQWKGDKVKYGSLHDYIKFHIPKPDLCQICDKVKKLEIANISGKYLRALNDWHWICRRCHMNIDGRINNLKQFRRVKKC